MKRNTSGFISIFTALMLMGILALLVAGYAFTSRQAQRRTLDDQLSTQAFYAAESGVNEAIEVLRDPNNTITTKDECDGGPFSYDVDSSANLTYTCLLIETDVQDYVNDNVPVAGLGEAAVVPIEASAAPLYLDVEWDSTLGSNVGVNPNSYTSGSPTLTPDTTWGDGIGMVRLDLIPTDAVTDRGSIVTNSYTQFLYPSADASFTEPADYGILNTATYQGGTAVSRCTTTLPAPEYRCSVRLRIMNLGGAPVTRTSYYLRLQSYYNAVKVRVTPRTSANATVTLANLQAIIDSTGRAGDVFRRIQVRVPITNILGLHTPYALTTTDSICKRLVAAPPDASGAGGTSVSTPPEITDGSCSL